MVEPRYDWHDSACGGMETTDIAGDPLTLPCDCGFPDLFRSAYDDGRASVAATRAPGTLDVERARRCVVQASIYIANNNLVAAQEELAVALAASAAPTPDHEPWCYRRHAGDCVDGPSGTVAPDWVALADEVALLRRWHELRAREALTDLDAREETS